MVTTNDTTHENFYVYTDDIYGEWSEPILVAQGGIDPSLLFDDGHVYFISNGSDDYGDGGVVQGVHMKKKRYLLLLLAVLMIVLISILFIKKKIKIAPIFAGGFEVTGVDVSHYQGTIDWEKLATQNLDFAFIKATEGASFIDERFYDNWKEAEKTGLCIGAYHFFSFDSDGEKQAQFYIDTVGNLNGKMAPAVDVEFYGDKQSNPPEKDEVAEQLNKLLDTLEEYYKIKPVIYTTYSAYNSYIRGEFDDYPLWIRNVYYQPLCGTRGKWTFWQYTDTAVLEGYEGVEKYIDRNVFRGTKEELRELIVQCN